MGSSSVNMKQRRPATNQAANISGSFPFCVLDSRYGSTIGVRSIMRLHGPRRPPRANAVLYVSVYEVCEFISITAGDIAA